MTIPIVRPWGTGLIVLLFLLASGRASLASMSYSVYNDNYASSNGATLYGYSEMDDLGGCASGSPSPFRTDLYSPTRSAFGSGSTVSLPFNDEVGTWDVVGHYSFQCNCSPYGGGHTFNVADGDEWFWSIKITYYKNPVPDGGDCIYTQLACSSGTPTCAWGFGWHLKLPYTSCPDYMKRRWLTRQKVGVGNTVCVVGLDTPQGGPGPCT